MSVFETCTREKEKKEKRNATKKETLKNDRCEEERFMKENTKKWLQHFQHIFNISTWNKKQQQQKILKFKPVHMCERERRKCVQEVKREKDGSDMKFSFSESLRECGEGVKTKIKKKKQQNSSQNDNAKEKKKGGT